MVIKHRKRIAACNHLLYLHCKKGRIMKKGQGINNLTFDKLLKASNISSFGHLYDDKCMIILNDREREEELFKYPIRINVFIYNPQNEMFWHFRTKCSFPKTKRTSLTLFSINHIQ